jgi:hypothetical protein
LTWAPAKGARGLGIGWSPEHDVNGDIVISERMVGYAELTSCWPLRTWEGPRGNSAVLLPAATAKCAYRCAYRFVSTFPLFA